MLRKWDSPSCSVLFVQLWWLPGVERNEEERQRENRTRKSRQDSEKTRLFCGFLLWASFPRRVNQLRVTAKEPRGFFIQAQGSLPERAGWDSWATIQLSSLCFPLTHAAVVTPLSTNYTTTTHPVRGRFTCFVNVFTYFLWQLRLYCNLRSNERFTCCRHVLFCPEFNSFI